MGEVNQDLAVQHELMVQSAVRVIASDVRKCEEELVHIRIMAGDEK